MAETTYENFAMASVDRSSFPVPDNRAWLTEPNRLHCSDWSNLFGNYTSGQNSGHLIRPASFFRTRHGRKVQSVLETFEWLLLIGLDLI